MTMMTTMMMIMINVNSYEHWTSAKSTYNLLDTYGAIWFIGGCNIIPYGV